MTPPFRTPEPAPEAASPRTQAAPEAGAEAFARPVSSPQAKRPAPPPQQTLDDLLALQRSPGLRRLAWGVMLFLAIAIAWGSIARLDEVSTAEGEVVPQGKVKVIQHLEGGIITDIFVTEGDLVHPGAALMQLDLASGGINQEEMQVRIDGLRLTRARLLAEAEGIPLRFPVEEAKRRPSLVNSEENAWHARQSELDSTLQVLRQQVRQRENELKELDVKERATGNNLRLSRQKLAMSSSLLAEKLTPRMEHVQLQSEAEALQGELDSIQQARPRAEAALAEARGREKEETLRFQREAREQLNEVELNLARNHELQEKATDQQNRTEIRSPIDGVVKNMRFNTLGGVVKAGEPIMDIVPSKDNLVIEARLNPVDRGYVTEGQTATIKISTYDYARYGGLTGKVVMVAPDSTAPEKGSPYFRVLVAPEKYYLGRDENEYAITPGMQATVDIHTGTRSVLNYLIKPVLKLRHEAFRER